MLAADISSHQLVSSWPNFLGSIDILICKISEGTGYAWNGAGAALAQGRAAGKLIGAYHYAGVSGQPLGDPVAEADYFLAHYNWRPGEVPILDYEPSVYPADPDGWCAAWLSRVRSRLGVVPMIYLNHYYATVHSKWTKTRALGPGLWSAWYGANNGTPLPGEPSFAPWTEAMWQYTSNGSRPGISFPLDLSTFYGDAAAWRAYGTPGGSPDMPLTDADAVLVANKILDMPIGRGGDSQSGTTTLRATLSWSDQHVVDIISAVKAIPPAQVDVAALAQQLTAALGSDQAKSVATQVLAGLDGATISTKPTA